MENLFCVMVTIPSALGMIARAVYGECASDVQFWDTTFCNIDAPAKAVPPDMIMLTFLSPVASFVFLKGVKRETIIILWVA
jgi:hypothetical protein